MSEDKETQKRQQMMQFQILQQQMMQMQQQLQVMEQHEQELQKARESIQDMDKEQAGSELFAPLTSGIFIKTELKDSKSFLVNVGNNVMVEKPAKDVLKLMDQQVLELTKVKAEIENQMQMLTKQAMDMESTLR